MRIAIDARLNSYISGGTSRYTKMLVQALAGLGTGDELTVLEGRGKLAEAAWPSSARRLRLATPPHHRLEQLTLPVELLRVQVDLLHSPDFVPPFRRRCRSVITIHDLAFMRFPRLLTAESARYYGQVGKAVESADQVIAVSHSTKRDLLEMLRADPNRITVVHEAASPDCRPLHAGELLDARSRLGLPERFILFVGTLEPRKNLPGLLQAFALVPRDLRPPLVVVGSRGWLHQDVFETRDRLGLGDEVVFPGAVPGEQLVYYYNLATCLVQPSLYEGFGLPVLEAMACGTPVIVSSVSSLPEVAGDAGLRVDPHDAEGLRDALTRLLSNDELRQQQREAGLLRSADFSWERAARETRAVYLSALGRSE